MILSHLLSSYYKTKSASTLSRGSKMCNEVDMGPLIIHTVIILCLWCTYIIIYCMPSYRDHTYFSAYIACPHKWEGTAESTLHQKQTKTQDKTRKNSSLHPLLVSRWDLQQLCSLASSLNCRTDLPHYSNSGYWSFPALKFEHWCWQGRQDWCFQKHTILHKPVFMPTQNASIYHKRKPDTETVW